MRFNGREVSGGHNPQSKLSDEYRACLRETKGQVPAKSVAKIYNVSERTVYDVWARLPIANCQLPIADLQKGAG